MEFFVFAIECNPITDFFITVFIINPIMDSVMGLKKSITWTLTGDIHIFLVPAGLFPNLRRTNFASKRREVFHSLPDL